MTRAISLLAAALLAISMATSAFAIDMARFEDPAKQERYLKLTHELRCMQCQNTSIADSQVDLAADLRREVYDLVEQGKSDDEIRQFMVDRYGEFILFRPLTNARNMWLWAAPGIFLVIGIGVAVRVIRQRSKMLGVNDGPDDPLVDDPAVDDLADESAPKDATRR
jgi:cytochrome c-type biogenesis protein CcmH